MSKWSMHFINNWKFIYFIPFIWNPSNQKGFQNPNLDGDFSEERE